MKKLNNIFLQMTNGSFHYFIIHPKQTRVPTFFNEFSREILPMGAVLDVIERLPTHIDEYKLGWPASVDVMVDYRIYIVGEDYLKSNMQFINQFKYGCIFFLPGITDKTIECCISNASLPIISDAYPQTINIFDDKIVESIHRLWEIKHPNIIWNLNQTNFSVNKSMPSTISMLPYSSLLRRLRGLYAKSKDGLELKVPKRNLEKFEDEEGKEIASTIKTIIAEKLLASISSCYLKGEKEIYSVLQERFNITDEELQKISERNWDEFGALAESIKENDNINDFKTDMVLLAHSTNYPVVKYKNNLLEKRKQIPNKLLKAVCDAQGYFPTIEEGVIRAYSEEKIKLYSLFINDMISDRTNEVILLYFMHVLFALGRRLPYITSRHIPSSQFYNEAYVISEISAGMETCNKVPRFNEGIRYLKNIINNAYPKKVNNTIRTHGEHIKIISDLPLEWMEFDGLPMFIHNTVSRIPITPGYGLLQQNENTSLEYELSGSTTKILILNTLSPDEVLFKNGIFLYKLIQGYFASIKVEIKYVEIESKSNFKETMEEFKPSIFIYYGHGNFDKKKMRGSLAIRNKEKIERDDLLQLKHKPLITILGACDTHVMNGAYENIANLMLMGGSISVIGTFFPIDGDIAIIYISNLMSLLSERLMGIDVNGYYEKWSDIIQKTQRMIYQMEPVLSMAKHIKTAKVPRENLIRDFYSYCDENKIYGIDSYLQRDHIYEKIFEKYPEISRKFSRLKNTSIIPVSLFYTSLGAPERIRFISPIKTEVKEI